MDLLTYPSPLSPSLPAFFSQAPLVDVPEPGSSSKGDGQGGDTWNRVVAADSSDKTRECDYK